jgi:hypothetical protein
MTELIETIARHPFVSLGLGVWLLVAMSLSYSFISGGFEKKR